jgi:hypothetical protein
VTSAAALTNAQFSDALTDESLRVTRLLHGAIMTGPLLFLLVVLAVSFYQTGGLPPRPSDFELLNILSAAHVVLFLVAVGLAQFLPGLLFAPDRVGEGTESATADTLAARCVAQQRIANVVRLVPLEGTSLFGLAVCFMGVMNRAIQAEPWYWLNAVSTGLFLSYAWSIFPTRQNLVDWFDQRMHRTM